MAKCIRDGKLAPGCGTTTRITEHDHQPIWLDLCGRPMEGEDAVEMDRALWCWLWQIDVAIIRDGDGDSHTEADLTWCRDALIAELDRQWGMNDAP